MGGTRNVAMQYKNGVIFIFFCLSLLQIPACEMFMILANQSSWRIKFVRLHSDGSVQKGFHFVYETQVESAMYMLKKGWGFSEALSEVVASYVDQAFRLNVVKHQAAGGLLRVDATGKVNEASIRNCLNSSSCWPCAVMRKVESFYPVGFVEVKGDKKVVTLNETVAMQIRLLPQRVFDLHYFSKAYGGVLFLDSLIMNYDRTINNCFVDANGILFSMDNGGGFGCRRECRTLHMKSPLKHMQQSGYRECVKRVWGVKFETKAYALAMQHVGCILRSMSLPLGELSVLLRGDSLISANALRPIQASDPEECLMLHLGNRVGIFQQSLELFLAEVYVSTSDDKKCSIDFHKLITTFVESRARTMWEKLVKKLPANWECPAVQF